MPRDDHGVVRDFLDARRLVQLAALALAVAAAAFLLGYPTYSGRGAAGDAPTASLVEVNGRGVLWLLAAPVVLVATPALWPHRGRTAAIVACTVLLWLLCLAGLLSIGLFFLPAALVSGVALLVPARPLRRPRLASQPS